MPFGPVKFSGWRGFNLFPKLNFLKPSKPLYYRSLSSLAKPPAVLSHAVLPVKSVFQPGLDFFPKKTNFFSTFSLRKAEDVRAERLGKIHFLLKRRIGFSDGMVAEMGKAELQLAYRNVFRHITQVAQSSPQDAAHILRVLESQGFKLMIMSAAESIRRWGETRYGCYLPDYNCICLVYSAEELIQKCLPRAILQLMRGAWTCIHNSSGNPIAVFPKLSAEKYSRYITPGKNEALRVEIKQRLQLGFNRILELSHTLSTKNQSSLSPRQKDLLTHYQKAAEKYYTPEIWGGCFDVKQYQNSQIAVQIAKNGEAESFEVIEVLGHSVRAPFYISRADFAEDGFYYFNCCSTSWTQPNQLSALVYDTLRRVSSYEVLYGAAYKEVGKSVEAQQYLWVEKMDTHLFEMGSCCVEVFFPELWEFYQKHGLVEKIEQDFDVELVSSPVSP